MISMMNDDNTISQLYPWQQSCLDLWFGRDCRGIVAAVTGSGKTMLAIRAAVRLGEELASRGEELRIKIAVPKTFLLSHWRAAFLRENAAARPEIGLWCGDRKDDPSRRVMIYLLNSARYSLARHILADIRAGRHALLIVDECHHLMGEKNMKILDFLPRLGERSGQYHALALSATAESVIRDKYLTEALGGVVYRYSLSQAMRDGVVSDFAVLPVSVPLSPDERDEYELLSFRLAKAITAVKQLRPALRVLSGADFFAGLQALSAEGSRAGEAAALVLRLSHKRREVMHMAGNRILCACELAVSMPPGSKIILFGERIECARRIHAILEERLPGEATLCHSGMGADAMRLALSRYQSGEARILITCRALDEGLDVPETDVGIAVSSTRAERQRIQRLGRILRKSGSPLPAKLYYIYLEDSGEETVYLEQDFSARLISMSYSEDGGFFSEEYEA
jgi:superfamily II DNA or RNA helicase